MNMSIRQYIAANYLRPADVIVVKKVAGLLDQFLVYLGLIDGIHRFMVHLQEGVRVMTEFDLVHSALQFVPVKIRRFQGTDQEREWAVNRAWSRRDEGSYRLVLSKSEENEPSNVALGVGIGLLLLGLGIALFGGGDEKENR